MLNYFGFYMDEILHSGYKQHNLMLSLLENLGFKRIKLICQLTFKQIRQSDTDTIPLFGSKLDNSTPKNPKAIKTLNIKQTEFSTRNPTLRCLSNITDFIQTFHINSIHFFQHGIHPETNPLNKIDDNLTIKSKKQLETLVRKPIPQEAYILLCHNIKRQIQELKTDTENNLDYQNFMEIILHKPKSNNLIQALQRNTKSAARLARLAILKKYPSATQITAQKFAKESIRVSPEQLAKATLMSFKLPLGPAIRNYNFRNATRQILNEKVLAKI